MTPEFERIRMTRLAGGGFALGGHAVHIAREADFDGVRAVLHGSFDPRTGCLPTESELRNDIMQGNVLCVKDSTVCGVLRTVPRPASVEIRQLAVREDARRRGVAKSLVHAFVDRHRDKKSTVWVLDGNAPALRVYTSAGFDPDGWRSTVLTLSIERREAL
jgi:GNAT superfamily N-acetyltransferase